MQDNNASKQLLAGKRALVAAVRAKDAARIRSLWEELVTLRGEQLSSNLSEMNKKAGTANDAMVRREIKRYLTDCYGLSLLLYAA